MLHIIHILENSYKAPNQISAAEQENYNSFFKFIAFQKGRYITVQAGETFNLINVYIPKSWVLLDIQSTIHLFCYTDYHTISIIQTSPGTMAVHCNAGVTKTKTIGDIAVLKNKSSWIHISIIYKSLSLPRVTMNYFINYLSIFIYNPFLSSLLIT